MSALRPESVFAILSPIFPRADRRLRRRVPDDIRSGGTGSTALVERW